MAWLVNNILVLLKGLFIKVVLQTCCKEVCTVSKQCHLCVNRYICAVSEHQEQDSVALYQPVTMFAIMVSHKLI